MREDGFDAGWRRIGAFFLWAIPLVLGAAACTWLGFAIASHDFFNQLSQEQRRAIYVGAKVAPKAKLLIETPNEGPVKITRVDLDGSTAAVYYENTSRETQQYIKIQWTLISPDGTLLSSDYAHANTSTLHPGEKGETLLEGYSGIKMDKRAIIVRFEVKQ